MHIETLINKIRERPSLYLGGRSILRLKSFLDGYYFALSVNNIESGDDDFWAKFQSTIVAKYHVTTSQNWAQVLLFFSNDEAEALDEFFKLFEEFVSTI
jgi:hypothetical protein